MLTKETNRLSATAPMRHSRFAPVIPLSVLTHVAALAALALQFAWWPWALAAIVLNHLVIGVGVLTPRSSLLGPNLTRLPPGAIKRGQVCITFDDGPDTVVTPRVLDILDRYSAKASFFCVGTKAMTSPDLIAEIVRRGHSVENHSHRHSAAFAFHGWSRLQREVDDAQCALAEAAGTPPLFFRAPIGFRSMLLNTVLCARGLRYVSWTRRGFDGVSTNADQILRRLTRGLGAGDIVLLHDRHNPNGDHVVVGVLPALLEQIQSLGLQPVSLREAFRDERAV